MFEVSFEVGRQVWTDETRRMIIWYQKNVLRLRRVFSGERIGSERLLTAPVYFHYMNSVNENFEKEEVTRFDGKFNVPGEDNEYVAQSMPFQCRYLDL